MTLFNPRKTNTNKNDLLWWIAILSLTISITAYILLDDAAKLDSIIERQRLFYLFLGFIISGVCVICSNIKNWYKS